MTAEGRTIAYVLCPGWISSSSDGDHHYIDASQLARLYGLDLNDADVRAYSKSYKYLNGVQSLYPRYKGDYWNVRNPV